MATTICTAFNTTIPKVCSELKRIPTNSPDNALFQKKKTETEKLSNQGLFGFVVLSVVLAIILVFLYKHCMGNRLSTYLKTKFRREFQQYTAIELKKRGMEE